ncbi:MAG: hypothetical protein RPR40_07720 [Bermanella sp.]
MQSVSRLGALLIKKNIISLHQLDAALQHQLRHPAMQLGQVLIELGTATEKQITKALHKQSRLRLVAAAVAFMVAPLQLCHASHEIESLPEYSYTQVADQQYSHDRMADFTVDINSANLDMLKVTTSAAWYLYSGGLANNELNDMPLKVSLSATDKEGYTLGLSISF